MITHAELMQYANAFFMSTKLFPKEIEAHIRRDTELFPDRMAMLRVQGYRNALDAQASNSTAAIAEVKVGLPS